MNFEQLVAHIKKDGCSVRLYSKELLQGAECMGTFDVSKKGNPIICLATLNHGRLELIRTLLHEYGHYCQWKDGFLSHAEGNVKGWDILDKWLRGKKYSKPELLRARNCVLLIEYDAEIRTIQLARALNIDIGDVEAYCNDAHSYIAHLKKVFVTRKWEQYGRLEMIEKKLTPREVLAPLTPKEKFLLDMEN